MNFQPDIQPFNFILFRINLLFEKFNCKMHKHILSLSRYHLVRDISFLSSLMLPLLPAGSEQSNFQQQHLKKPQRKLHVRVDTKTIGSPRTTGQNQILVWHLLSPAHTDTFDRQFLSLTQVPPMKDSKKLLSLLSWAFLVLLSEPWERGSPSSAAEMGLV